MADIEAMFYQVHVHDDHRDFGAPLWGIFSIANFAIKQTAKDNSHKYKEEAIRTIRHNFYVDNCLKSVATVEQAISKTSKMPALREAFHGLNGSQTAVKFLGVSQNIREPVI